jgi:hypothetical protein
MRFDAWNVRSLYRAGSLTAAAATDLTRDKSSITNRIFVHHGTVSAVKRTDFVSDRVSYIVLRGRWCNVIVLNVHAPSEGKIDHSKCLKPNKN